MNFQSPLQPCVSRNNIFDAARQPGCRIKIRSKLTPASVVRMVQGRDLPLLIRAREVIPTVCSLQLHCPQSSISWLLLPL